MPWFGWLFAAIAALALVYLWLIAPSGRRPDASALLGTLCAHRGLHDGNRQVFENSMKAFALAADGGYGIEMDVQLTLDHRLVIHHDASTARICGEDRVIGRTNYADLPALPDGSQIPLFSELLSLIRGRVPLIVEIKGHGDHDKTAAATLAHLREYRGPYCVESFSPQIVGYFRRHAPGIIRGQLADGNPGAAKAKGFFHYFTHKHLLYNFLGRPHFIAYSCRHPASLSLRIAKRVFRAFLVAWTVKDQPLLNRSARLYDAWIFEGFMPRRPAGRA